MDQRALGESCGGINCLTAQAPCLFCACTNSVRVKRRIEERELRFRPVDKFKRACHLGLLTLPVSPLPPLSDFSASDLRVLRASVNAFMDMTALCTRTLETFGDRPLLG